MLIPLRKTKGSKNGPKFYRPTKYNSTLEKNVKIVESQLSDYIHRNELLRGSQNGQIRQCYCSSCQSSFHGALSSSWDKGLLAAIVYSDMTKALDRVSLRQVIFEVHCFGIIRLLSSKVSSFSLADVTQLRSENAYHPKRRSPVLLPKATFYDLALACIRK